MIAMAGGHLRSRCMACPMAGLTEGQQGVVDSRVFAKMMHGEVDRATALDARTTVSRDDLRSDRAPASCSPEIARSSLTAEHVRAKPDRRHDLPASRAQPRRHQACGGPSCCRAWSTAAKSTAAIID